MMEWSSVNGENLIPYHTWNILVSFITVYVYDAWFHEGENYV